MKKIIFSFTLICYSLSGRTNIVDAYHNIPTQSNTNTLINNVPLTNPTIPPVVANILDIPAIVPAIDPGTIVDVISNPTDSLPAITMPDIVSTVVNVITNPTNSVNGLTTPDIVGTVVDILPKNRFPLVNTLPNLDSILSVPDLATIPNITDNLPALAITDALPTDVLVIEDIITNELLNNVKHEKINCYKKTVDNITYFIFVPHVQKGYFSESYQTIIELIANISSKLQEYFGQTAAQPTIAADEATTASETENIA